MRKMDLRTLFLVLAALIAIGCSTIYAAAQQSTTTTTTSTTTSDESNSISGCIVKRATDYYIEPLNGAETKLNAGSQDLSAHEGHNVRVTGKMQSSTSASNTSQTGTSAQTGTSNQSATSGTSTTNEPEFLVTKVDMLESQCPPEIQKKIDARKNATSPK